MLARVPRLARLDPAHAGVSHLVRNSRERRFRVWAFSITFLDFARRASRTLSPNTQILERRLADDSRVTSHARPASRRTPRRAMLAARGGVDDDPARAIETVECALDDLAIAPDAVDAALALASDERLLDALRALRATPSPRGDDVVNAGEAAERWMARLKSPLEGWTRQRSMTKSVSGAMLSAFARGASSTSTSTARRAPETRIYYKCDDERTLSVRVETVIERDLLVPLLSVLNESELYSEWLPRWTTPTRLGVRSSEKVAQVGRCSQLVVITCDAPWPLETRQVVLDARAFDDMETSGDIGVLLRTRDCEDDDRVPPKPTDEDVTRIDVDGAFLFRRVPDGWDRVEGEEACDVARDDMLTTFGFTVDPKLEYIPTWLLNFIVRTVIGTLWGAFIRVAEEVRDGKRPIHADVIAQKRAVLYDWIEERVERMFIDKLE